MQTQDVLERVRQLRATGATPKVVARALGLPPAQVAPLVRAVAAEAGRPSGDGQTGERAVVGCWVSAGWSEGVTVTGHPQWREHRPGKFGADGLAGVLIARAKRPGRVTICGYLVDAYCLGVKDALGPKGVDDGPALEHLKEQFFAAFGPQPPVVAPLELAQHLVFGAVEYARGLGFRPHPDFAAAARHLGSWTGPSAITFGKDGKPLYIQGPHDNAARVVRTLQASVGEGNYDFVIVMPA